jgi:hypothetical protein
VWAGVVERRASSRRLIGWSRLASGAAPQHRPTSRAPLGIFHASVYPCGWRSKLLVGRRVVIYIRETMTAVLRNWLHRLSWRTGYARGEDGQPSKCPWWANQGAYLFGFIDGIGHRWC